MKKFDMHIHTYTENPTPEKLIAELEKAGFYGGCIFSAPPIEASPINGMSFEKRIKQLKGWTENHKGRLFPILWMHPNEENAEEKVKKAISEGVCGFKFILHDRLAGSEECIKLFRFIAECKKPIFFHSGILWSSNLCEVADFNRPVNFEAMLRVPGARFSLAHCSWPWTDECIALYGRMGDAKRNFPKGIEPCEMFLDTTPGTPDNYREDLLTKLVSVDMDNVSNIMFGVDQVAERYSAERLTHIYELDRKIMDKLGVCQSAREKIFGKNLLRFLGVENQEPKPEKESFFNSNVKEICRKWYKKLGFAIEYNSDFEAILSEYNISDAINIENYDLSEKDGKRNLLSFLYMCEEAERKYKEMGIDESILIDTLSDIRLWAEAWTDVKGELCLFELPWLKGHMSEELFRIGSLEYRIGKSEFNCRAEGLKKGDDIIEIHIPSGAKLTPEKVFESLTLAKEFYKKHFPSYKYTHFTFHSWMMDKSLEKLLKEDSNILKFQKMFTPEDEAPIEDYAALRYVFRWNTTRMNVLHEYPCSSFAERLKSHVLTGGKLYVAGGALKK